MQKKHDYHISGYGRETTKIPGPGKDLFLKY